jgi:hypothetical protein
LGGFFLCSPNCLKQPKTSFPFYKFFYPTISGRISGFTDLPKCGEGDHPTCPPISSTYGPDLARPTEPVEFRSIFNSRIEQLKRLMKKGFIDVVKFLWLTSLPNGFLKDRS